MSNERRRRELEVLSAVTGEPTYRYTTGDGEIFATIAEADAHARACGLAVVEHTYAHVDATTLPTHDYRERVPC